MTAEYDPYGMVIWDGHIGWSYGMVIWDGHNKQDKELFTSQCHSKFHVAGKESQRLNDISFEITP